MKVLIGNLKKEFTPDNLIAAVSCLILSITIFFILAVVNREGLL